MNFNDFNLVNDIYKYILLKNQITLIHLKSDFKKYVMGLDYNNSQDPINYNKKFYYVIDYLLINGYIEYSYDKNSEVGVELFPTINRVIKYNNYFYVRELPNLFYVQKKIVNNEYITLDPLKILKVMPKVEDVCNSFTTNEPLNFRFTYDRKMKLKNYSPEIKKYTYEVGIYKINDFGSSFLVLKDNTIKRISRKTENYDELNYSFCYKAMFSGVKIFSYNHSKRKLVVTKRYIPILIFRVLTMCDFNPLLDNNLIDYPKYEFNNVSNNIVTELKRIFSQDVIGEIYD